MKTLIALSLIVSTSAFAAKSTAGSTSAKCNDEAHYPEISTTELKTVAEKKEATLIDVNSKESYAETHIGDAIHYGTDKKSLAKKLPSDKGALIVAYCGGPACTAWKKAAVDACKMGYTNVKHYKEGITGWKKNQG
jgi:rhodanese-related sulfurtransferase